MYYKTEGLNYDEKKLNKRFSELIHWAKENNRQDIVEESNKLGTIKNQTSLKKEFYRLYRMKGETNISTPKIETKMVEPSETSSSSSTETPIEPSVRPIDSNQEFDPLLSANPKQRDYTSGMPTDSTNQAPMGSIPEPNFVPKSPLGGGIGSIPPNETDKRFESTNDLPPNEKSKSTEQLVEILVGTFSTYAPKAFTHFAQISKKKVEVLVASGQLDLNIVLENKEQGRMPLGDYINRANAEIEQAFVVTEEWKEEVKPVLKRVLEKKNWGVTDEQTLMFMVGMYALSGIVTTISIKNSNDAFLQGMVNQTNTLRESGALPRQPMPPPPPSNNASSNPTPPPPPPSPSPSPSDILTPEVEIVPNEPQGVAVYQNVEDEFSRQENSRTARGMNRVPVEEMEDMPTANSIANDNDGFQPNI